MRLGLVLYGHASRTRFCLIDRVLAASTCAASEECGLKGLRTLSVKCC